MKEMKLLLVIISFLIGAVIIAIFLRYQFINQLQAIGNELDIHNEERYSKELTHTGEYESIKENDNVLSNTYTLTTNKNEIIIRNYQFERIYDSNKAGTYEIFTHTRIDDKEDNDSSYKIYVK